MTQSNSRHNELEMNAFLTHSDGDEGFRPESRARQYCRELFYSPAGKTAFLSIVSLCVFTYAVMIGQTIEKSYGTVYSADIKNGIKLYPGNGEVALVISPDYRDFTGELSLKTTAPEADDLNALMPAAGE